MDEFDKRLYVGFDMKIYNNNLLLELIAKKKKRKSIVKSMVHVGARAGGARLN